MSASLFRGLLSALVFSGAPVANAATPQPGHIEVFVTAATPFDLGERGRRLQAQGTLIVHRLDAMADIDRQLSRGLSRDPGVAKAQVAQRLADPNALAALWSRAAQASLRAGELGIDRVPAVVFDEGLVVYGARDLAVAWNRWRQRAEPTP